MSETDRDNPTGNDFSEWCRGHLDRMAEGGIWGVPRSGLIFTKREGNLVLTQRMPFAAIEAGEMDALGKDGPDTPEKLRTFQDADYEVIREQFQIAGIEVVSDLD